MSQWPQLFNIRAVFPHLMHSQHPGHLRQILITAASGESAAGQHANLTNYFYNKTRKYPIQKYIHCTESEAMDCDLGILNFCLVFLK